MSLNRRQVFMLSSAALAAAPFRSLLAWQAPAAAPATLEAIRRNVGFFGGRGGTIGWLVNNDVVVVIDTQYADTAPLFLNALKQKSNRGIDVLFNTHHHGDHIGGNQALKPVTKKLVTHARVPELSKQGARGANPIPPVVPDATFDKTWSEELGGETVTATHYGPGHTGGDAVIRFERANVVHMGDLFFNEFHPFVDRPGGASLKGWLTNVETVAKQYPADAVYIAGHARPGASATTSRKELLRQRDYLDAVLGYVQKGIAAGRSKEEIASLKVLPGFETHQSMPPILTLSGVLNAAFDELKG